MDLKPNNYDQSYIIKIAGSKWLIAGLVILIVAVILGAYTMKHKEPVKKFAQTGQVVDGFPKDLVFDPVSVDQSFSIKYDSKLNQYSVQYESKDEYSVVLARTISYFKNNGYYVSNRFSDAEHAIAYGIKDDKTISLIATPLPAAPKQPKTSNVFMTFVIGKGTK